MSGGATLTRQSTATKPLPPLTSPFDPEGFPDELKALPQWVGWDWEWIPPKNDRPAKWTKVPKNPRTGANGSTTRPTNWGTLAEAMAAAERYGWHGVGIVFTRNDPYFGIDRDGSDDPALRRRVPTFAEASVCGGTHIIGKATAFPHERSGNKKGDIEVYWHSRFFACTGAAFALNRDIIDCTESLAAWHAETFAAQAKSHGSASRDTVPVLADDETVIANGRRMKQWAPLFERGERGKHPSPSEADAAMLWLIVRAGARDAAQVERIARRSARVRERWDERRGDSTWLANEIASALANVEPFDGWDRPANGHGPVSLDGAVGDATGDPCAVERDQNADLRAALATALAERDQARRDLAAVMQTLGNPNLGGDAAGKALVLAAAEVQAQARHAPEDGYVRATATRVADNQAWVANDDGEQTPIPVPGRISPRTVTKYLRLAADKGLIDAEKRSMPITAKNGRELSTDVWFWKAAPTLADQLAPLAVGTVYGSDTPRPRRGGDPTKRRVRRLPGCPECGGRDVACRCCGVIFELPAAVDLRTAVLLSEDDLAEAARAAQYADHINPVDDERMATSLSGSDARPTVPAAEEPPAAPPDAHRDAENDRWHSRPAMRVEDRTANVADRPPNGVDPLAPPLLAGSSAASLHVQTDPPPGASP